MIENNKTTKTDLYKIDPRNIVIIDGFNSRNNFGDLDELASQIKEQGVLNPISVMQFKDEDGNDKYRLIDGERRYRAVMKLINEGHDIARIPAIFLSKSTSEEELLIQQALRNEGKNFNEYEWGILAMKLQERCGLTKSEIAKKLGKNQGVVSYWFQLLEMKKELQEFVRDGVISGPNLRRMLKAYDKDEEAVYKAILNSQNKNEDEDITTDDNKPKNKFALKNLDEYGQNILKKETKDILKGLQLFMKYVNRFKEDNPNAKIKLTDVLDALQDYSKNDKDKSIKDALVYVTLGKSLKDAE